MWLDMRIHSDRLLLFWMKTSCEIQLIELYQTYLRMPLVEKISLDPFYKTPSSLFSQRATYSMDVSSKMSFRKCRTCVRLVLLDLVFPVLDEDLELRLESRLLLFRDLVAEEIVPPSSIILSFSNSTSYDNETN